MDADVLQFWPLNGGQLWRARATASTDVKVHGADQEVEVNKVLLQYRPYSRRPSPPLAVHQAEYLERHDCTQRTPSK